jgi:pimeloyl-ACP methyl ester carboxylesterase
LTSLAMMLVAIATLIGLASAGNAATITPPPQPASGPGGAGYPWSGYTEKSVTFTDATKDYWTFDPSGWQGTGAAPAKAPLVVFVHGWLGDDPAYYMDWITHLVRKGNVVVFPRYQTSAATPPSTFTGNAIYSLHDALPKLADAPVAPDTAAGMTLVSHSWGGPVSANIANRWSAENLPKPKAVLFAEPYDQTIDASLAGIPATTKIDCVVGDADTTVGRTGCDAIWDLTGQVPAANRNYIWMYGDAHGTPALVADHRTPTSNTSASSLDALDWYGLWKLGDGIRDCGVYGTDCAYALGDTPKQTFMGDWSDGTPVAPLTVTTAKPACPVGTTAKGC